jgi:glycosyltransferase involved in cell wall biosynthesis
MIRGHGYLDLTLPHVQWTGRHFQHALERFCLQRADFVLTNSEYMAQTYEQEFGVKRDDVAALDLPFLEPAEARSNLDLRSQLGWQAEDPVVAFVGTLELRKGVDLLFQALTRVHRRLPAMKAIFLGQLLKDVEASYHAFMAEAAGWAYHPGAVEAGLVDHYLRQADLLVLPSRFEPMGRVLVEAQAAGIPQIATRAGGMPEVVKDGVTGLLVEPGQPHALAEAILQLCLSPEQRAEMGSKSRQRFLEKYNIDTVMPRQVRVYEALVKGESPAIVLEGTV